MIDFLKDWVMNIVILVIFIVLLEMLIPSGKTKKFINLISGFILLIAIINPFLGLFKKGINVQEFQLTNSNFIDKKEIERDSKVLKDNQIKQIIEVYRKKIIRQLEDCLSEIEGIAEVKADVIINEDYQSEKFGEIKRAYLELRMEKQGTKVEPVASVKKIEIKNSEDKLQEKKEVDSEIKKKVEDRINKLMEVQKENIVVTLMES